MTERAHAELSASGAHIWIPCPGSVQKSRGLPDSQSIFAAEGTAAHQLAETCARTGKPPIEFLGDTITVGEHEFTVDDDMVRCIDMYVTEVWPYMDGNWEFDIESRVDLSNFHPGMFGTADFLAYHPVDKKLLVVDYKHGRGVAVEVRNNPQLLYYAAGAVERHHNRGIAEITMRVVQPRCKHPDGLVRSETIDSVTLMEWCADLVDAAKATEEEDAPLNPGEWCRFCKAAAICPALEDAALAAAKADFSESGELIVSDPTTYDPETLAEALHKGVVIEAWLHRMREFAHHEAEAGRCPPGWKLVAKRAVRRWKSEADARDFLEMYGLDAKDIMTEPEMKSPAQMDKVLKKEKGVIAEFVEKKSSGTVLATLDDERPPVTANAEEDFAA